VTISDHLCSDHSNTL